MSNVLLDTNILLDIMLDDRPGSAIADSFLKMSDSNDTRVSISAGSLKDIYYISGKYLGEPLARDWVRFFINEFTIASIDKAVCEVAIDSSEPDFEDGIVRAIAELEDTDFILTRDKEAFRESTVRSIDVETFINFFEK